MSMDRSETSELPQLGEYVDLIRRGRPGKHGFHLDAPVECVTSEGWRLTINFQEPDVQWPEGM